MRAVQMSAPCSPCMNCESVQFWLSIPSLPSSFDVMAMIESRSSTPARPRICSSVRGRRSAMEGSLSESGEQERSHEATGVVLLAQVEPLAGDEDVGQDEPGHPLA